MFVILPEAHADIDSVPHWNFMLAYDGQHTCATWVASLCSYIKVHSFLNNCIIFSFNRLLWICLIIISAVITTVLILQSWNKLQDNPTVVTIEKNYNEWSMPWPAITVCPPNVLTRGFKKILQGLVNHSIYFLSYIKLLMRL